MIFQKKIGLAIPAYNEAGYITKTLASVPDYVDVIVCINDASLDSTLQEMEKITAKDKRLIILTNKRNRGVGYSVKRGLQQCLKEKVDYLVIAPGDNQCDLGKISEFIESCESAGINVCRANRFLNRQELFHMPPLRRWGNSVYSFLMKFVSGYYSLFDFQSTFGAYQADVVRQLNFSKIRDDYLFDNSVWINLNIVGATIKEISVPVIYAGEKSDIKYGSFIFHSIKYLIPAFLDRIYQKYLLILHPVGLFYLGGGFLFFFGLIYGSFIALGSLGPTTASTATVMLSVVPFILGFQLLLQAIVLDIQNEPK
jgi:dolichol-phosphate mannosyltransferase